MASPSSFNWSDALKFNFKPEALAGTSTPGSSGASSDMFGSVFNNVTGQATMAPANPQDNFLGMGMTKEEALKLDPSQALTFGLLAGKQNQNIYDDPNRLRELMGVYSEYRLKEAQEANKMSLQRQALAGLQSAARSVADIYSARAPMYLAGYERGGIRPFARNVTFQ
jgi:hypothetical protein